MSPEEKLDMLYDILSAALDCRWKDIQKLLEIADFANRIDVKMDFFEIVNRVKEYDMRLDINSVLYETMYWIMEDLLEDVDIDTAEMIWNEWSPFINYFDSWFNNPIDELLYEEDVSREGVIQKLIKFYIERRE